MRTEQKKVHVNGTPFMCLDHDPSQLQGQENTKLNTKV